MSDRIFACDGAFLLPQRGAIVQLSGKATCLSREDMVLARKGVAHALQTVLMVRPNQAGSLQGSLCVGRDILAANDLGIGSDWKQGRQN